MMVSMLFIMIPRAQVSAGRINEVLDLQPEIKNPPFPKAHAAERGTVAFNKVFFSYHGAEEPALEDISFCAQAGQVTAIIGSTGSGKTTLVSLLPRFYDVTGGSVCLSGVDLRDLDLEQLRRRIGYVPQKATLFTGTIRDNLRFGREDAGDDELIAAAQTAQAWPFIQAMEGGLDAMLVRGGANLSGGQKQRLAIARALVRKPEIYIFDDCFSALDFKTDAALRQALRQELTGVAILMVAQRVTTVMNAERILVLDEGRLVGQGRHQDLLTACPVYKEIVYSQLSQEELA
jgi:ATP-binding cassette subfamily B protein